MEKKSPPPSSSSEGTQNHPPSSSTVGTQKSIYLWFRDFEGGDRDVKRSTWCKLDPTQLDSKESELALISEGNLHQASSAVAWGSTIYVIGGNSRRRYINSSGYSSSCDPADEKLNRTCEVYYLDTRCLHLGWKKGPTLNSPRSKVEVIVKSGEIYAFGGGEFAYKKEWAKIRESRREEFVDHEPRDHGPRDENYGEVLNPLLGNWRSITGPDHETESEVEKLGKKYKYGGKEPGFNAAGAAHGFRVGWSYLYELESDTWRAWIGQKKTSSGHLGSIRSNLINGLGGKSARPPVDRDRAEFIVDIGGGRFCLIWEYGRGLHCSKFRVSVHDDGDGVVSVIGTVEAFRIFSNYKPGLGRYGDSRLKQCLSL